MVIPCIVVPPRQSEDTINYYLSGSTIGNNYVKGDPLEIIIHTPVIKDIPHFCVGDKKTHGDEFRCLIRIDKPEYLENISKEAKLTEEQKIKLIEFLQTEVNFGSIKLKNWDKILMYWNDNNFDVILDSDTVMPDYNKLG